jgi:hypothetical protein
MANARCDDENLSFAVFHVSEMLLNLNKHYKAAWRAERPGSRLITSPAKTTQEIKEAYRPLPAEDESRSAGADRQESGTGNGWPLTRAD